MLRFFVYAPIENNEYRVVLIIYNSVSDDLPKSGFANGYSPELKSDVVFDWSKAIHIHYDGPVELPPW